MQYSVLVNSLGISTALSMECTVVGGSLFQILSPFDTVLRASQIGGNIGFAVALQSGAFAVSQFSLLGAKAAIDRVLTAASQRKLREQKMQGAPQSPPKQVAPSLEIIPKAPPNRAPHLNPKPSSKEIAI